jgi:PAS domain S-box-containing protein
MRKVFNESFVESGTDVNRAILLLGSSKPFVCFNTDFQICHYNELFVALFKSSKNEILGINLNKKVQNADLVKAIRKAISEGYSTFKGKVLFEENLPEVYLEAVLFNFESNKPDETGVYCYILETAFPASYTKSSNAGGSSVSKMPGYPNASVSVHTPDGIAIYISPSTETMLGYSIAEIKEFGSLNLVYPEDLPIVEKSLEKLNSGFDFLNTRYRMVHKNGSVVFVETTSYTLCDASGDTNHIVNITWDLGSHQGMENALKISEQKYYRLVMNLPVGVSLIRADGQLLEANDAMKKIMQLPADFLEPELNFLSIKAMKRAGISAQFSRCIETKEMINGEIQFKFSSKTHEIYLSYSFVPILDHLGNVESVIGYVNDLTKQKQAEIDYHERADFLNLVINTIKTPFFVKDEDHKWVVLNDAAVEMMGQPRETLIGKSDYDLFPDEQADVFWKYDEMVFKSGSTSNEEQITWFDGTLHTIVTFKELYIEKPSGKKFIVGTIHDITNYKKIEEELRSSESKYRELFDNANDYILTTDFDGKITNANRTLLRYLQTDLESLMQHSVFEFIREESIDLANEIKAKILTGESDHSFEIKAYGVDKELVIYEVKANLISNNGELVGVQCVFSDVTERREASMRLEKYNADLVELNATKDKFFRIIAHDLRNPYSSIIGFSEMLLEDLEGISKDEIRDSLKIIHSAAKNSFSLLDNLLAWSRLETGSIPFTPVQVVLSDVVEEVVNVLFSLAYRKRIEIDNLVKPDVMLLADKNMLNTILNNLVMNAIKFTDPGGKIKIYSESETSESGKDFIRILIADNGIGMDAETIKTLFKLNRMASTPGTEKEQGTGLGLILVREMVEKHGGKINVESEPGKGSVFSFLIPDYKPGNNS